MDGVSSVTRPLENSQQVKKRKSLFLIWTTAIKIENDLLLEPLGLQLTCLMGINWFTQEHRFFFSAFANMKPCANLPKLTFHSVKKRKTTRIWQKKLKEDTVQDTVQRNGKTQGWISQLGPIGQKLFAVAPLFYSL